MATNGYCPSCAAPMLDIPWRDYSRKKLIYRCSSCNGVVTVDDPLRKDIDQQKLEEEIDRAEQEASYLFSRIVECSIQDPQSSGQYGQALSGVCDYLSMLKYQTGTKS